jgi:hypothetical protein
MEAKPKRQIQPHEWETIGKLAAEVGDLTKVEDRLLAAARGKPAGSVATLRPTTWSELMAGVRHGVLGPREAKRFVDIPEDTPGRWYQFWLRLQRGG